MFSFLSGKRTQRNSHAIAKKNLLARKSFFETLEGRQMLATLTWEGDVSTNWNDGVALTDTNWNDGVNQVLPQDGDTLVFSTPGVVTLTNDTTAGNSYALQFLAVGYTINGNAITLDVAGDDITDNSNTAINTPLTFVADTTFNITAGNTGFGGSHTGLALTKNGAGNITLAGAASNYTGGTTVNAGNVTAQTGAALGTGAVALNANTLNLTTGGITNYTFGGMSGNGVVNVDLGTGTNTTTFAAGAYGAFTGTLNVGTGGADTGKLQINNLVSLPAAATINVLTDATVYVSAAGTYNAPIFLNGGNTGESLGQLRLENATYAGQVTLAGAITGANDAFIGGNAPGTISGNIVESGGAKVLSKAGTGFTTLTGNANHTGGTTVLTGTLQIGNGGGTGTLNTNGNISLINGAGLAINKNVATTIPNPVTGSGVLTKVGTGNVIFSAPGGGNVFRTINVNNATGFIDLGAGNTTVSNTGGTIIQSSTGGNLRATGGTLLLSGGSATDGGNIGAAAGTLVIDAVMNTVTPGHAFELFGGNGTVRVTATNLFTGNVFVNQGILETAVIGNSGVAGPVGSGTTINLGNAGTTTTLRYTGTGENTNRTINLRGGTGGGVIENNGTTAPFVISGNVTVAAGGNKTLTLQGSSSAFAGAGGGITSLLADNGANILSLTKAGSGTWQISGAAPNTFTGTTTVNDGGLVLLNAAGNAVGGNVVVGNGGTNDSDKLQVSAANQIPDTATVTVNHSGHARFDANDTIGALNVQTGTNAAGAGAATVDTFFGNTLRVNGNINVTNLTAATDNTPADISVNLDLGGATSTITVADGAALNTELLVSGAVSNGGITKAGAGAMRLAGTTANTYAGNTTVNDGVLQLNKTPGVDAIGGGTLIIGNGGGNDTDIVQIEGANQIANGVALDIRDSGRLNLNNNTETIGALNLQTGTGAGATINTGTGTLTLGGNVAVTQIAPTDNTGANIVGAAGASLNLGGASRIVNVVESAAGIDLNWDTLNVVNGSIDKQGGGLLNFTGAGGFGLNLTSATVTNGTFQHAGGGASFALNGGTGQLLVQPGAFFVSGTGALINGALNIATGGTARFTATSTPSTASIEGSGNLILGNTSGSGTIPFTTGANGLSTEFSGVISQATGFTGSFTKVGAGTLTLNGANTYSGTTTVNNGILAGTGSVAGALNIANTTRLSPGSTANPIESFGSGNLGIAATAFLDAQIDGTAGAGVAGGHDTLIVTGSVTLTGSTLNLTGAFVPSSATLNSFTIINNDGADAVTGTFAGLTEGSFLLLNGQELFISYRGGTGNDVVLSTRLMGTPGADNVEYFPVDANNYQYRINGGPIHNVNENFFEFNGGGGDDYLRVNVNGNAMTGISFNGQGQDFVSRPPGGIGDLLDVRGVAAGMTATYTPDVATFGNGSVVVTGGVINFTGLEPVDLSGMVTATLNLPGANDVLNVANGFDAATGLVPALAVGGTSGGVAIESARFFNNTNMVINTNTVPGIDTININSADNAHANTNLTINTGAGADAVNVNADVNFAGTIDITTLNTNLSGGNVTSGSTQAYHSNVNLTADAILNGTTVSIDGNIVGGGNNLSVVGNAVLGNAPADTASGLATLAVSGTTLINMSSVGSTGTQSYGDDVTLSTNLAMTTSTVNFDGNIVGGGNNLIITGNAILGDAAADSATGLNIFNISGTTDVNAATITSTAAQTYGGAVTINNNLTMTTNTSITFNGTVDGAVDLLLNANVNRFNAPVGSLVPLVSLTTNAAGTTFLNGNSVDTTGNQTYNDAVTLESNNTLSAGGDIVFNSVVDGTFDLALNSPGLTRFNDSVGSLLMLGSITTDAAGTTEFNAANAVSAGDQTYNDPVSVLVNLQMTTILGGNVAFANTLDGPAGLTVNSSGNTTYSAPVGGTTPMAFLSTASIGTTFIDSGFVESLVGQVYSGNVLLGADTTLIDGNGITFFNDLDGGFNLNLNSPGAVTFFGPVGNTIPLNSLTTDAGGTTSTFGAIIHTFADQIYNDDLTIAANTTLTSDIGAITFNGLVDGTFDLAINNPGATTFAAAVGSVAPLNSITTDAGGTTEMNGGTIDSISHQTYNDVVNLGVDTTVTSTLGDIVFNDTVDGGVNANINSPTGITIFNGAVGSLVPLTSLTTDAAGATFINGGTVDTTADQTYNDAVSIGSNTVITSAGGNVTFNFTVDGSFFDLLIQSPGTTTFNGGVGQALIPLNSLTTDAPGTTIVNATQIYTINDQTYNDPVTAISDIQFDSALANIVFNSTLDGSVIVVVNSPADTIFNAPVGSNLALASLTTDAGGTTNINGGTIDSIGPQTYHDDVSLGANTLLNGSVMTFNENIFGNTFSLSINQNAVFGDDGTGTATGLESVSVAGTTLFNMALIETLNDQTYTGAATLGFDAILTSFGGSVFFGDTLDGAFNLLVNSSVFTTFTGPVGSLDPLASLTTDFGGVTQINGGAVTTTGDQTYHDDVTLLLDTTLTGANVIFDNNVTGNGYTNFLDVQGNAVFGDNSGGDVVDQISTLNVSGLTALNTVLIFSDSNQFYNGAVTLGGDSGLFSFFGDITFNDLVDGAASLFVAAGDLLTFNAAVGSIDPLNTLTGFAADIDVNDNITISGDASLTALDDAGVNEVTLANGITLTSLFGSILLGFGDNMTVNGTHTISALNGQIHFLSTDLDAGSIISLNGNLLSPDVRAEGADNADQFELLATVVFNPGTVMTMIGHDGDDIFGNATNRINPHQNAQLEIEGEDNTAIVGEPLIDFDTLYLDAAVLEAPVVFFAGLLEGFLDGSNTPPYGTVHYQDIEELLFYDNVDDDLPGPPNSGNLTTIELGNLYVRTTEGNDDVLFGRAGITSTDNVVVTISYPKNGSIITKKYPPSGNGYPMGAIAPNTKIVAFGKGGNDRIAASATLGNRIVEFHGNDGNDYLAGGGASDLLVGGRGNDTIIANAGNNVVWGDLEGGFNDATGDAGQTYNDTITAGGGADFIYGNLGNDSITAGSGNDVLYGGYGNDTLNAGDNHDIIRGGEGNDIIDAGAGNDILLGSGGDDKLYGRAGNDLAFGGAGKDSITGEGDRDIVSGGLHTPYNEQATLALTQAQDAALLAILAAWNGSGTPAAFLATPSGAALNANITDDLTADTVLGGLGNDLYYVHNTPTVPTTHDTHGPVEPGDGLRNI
jgi:autotransporter-associated beta strand protein